MRNIIFILGIFLLVSISVKNQELDYALYSGLVVHFPSNVGMGAYGAGLSVKIEASKNFSEKGHNISGQLGYSYLFPQNGIAAYIPSIQVRYKFDLYRRGKARYSFMTGAGTQFWFEELHLEFPDQRIKENFYHTSPFVAVGISISISRNYDFQIEYKWVFRKEDSKNRNTGFLALLVGYKF
jgi:hypothetical protein